MIVVTRYSGPAVALNCDLIERVEADPDTVLTLVDGSRFVVRESVAEVIDKVRTFRASVLVLAGALEREAVQPSLHAVPDPDDPPRSPA
jgi:flagellar protein FlbD